MVASTRHVTGHRIERFVSPGESLRATRIDEQISRTLAQVIHGFTREPRPRIDARCQPSGRADTHLGLQEKMRGAPRGETPVQHGDGAQTHPSGEPPEARCIGAIALVVGYELGVIRHALC